MAEQKAKIPSILEGKHLFKGDKPLLLIFFSLIVCSILVFYSASPKLGVGIQAITQTHSRLASHIFSIILGVIAAFITYIIPLKKINKLSRLAFYLSLFLTCITPFVGESINGATRWLRIFGFSFQPSEFLKISTIVFTAYLISANRDYVPKWSFLVVLRMCYNRNTQIREKDIDILKHGLAEMVLVCVAVVVVLLEHTSSAFLLGFSIFSVWFIGGIRNKELLKILAIGVILILAMVFLYNIGRSGTAKNRFKDWIELLTEDFDVNKKVNDFKDAEFSMAAIYNGGLYGNGAGQSIMRAKMTHPESDYIFGIFFEEYGLILAIPLILAYLWIFARCLIIAERSRWVYAQLSVFGLGLMMTTQAMIHFMVAVNFAPETGQTLPLISHGGSSIICYSIAMGYILNASKQQEI
ncbi:MAG: FtsW/RodA/SpoVE family cell cycle protein [Alistipes sp.]|nr:FtsW/RodA/SpoVE family cell cycle protein [Candidatus Alistipes equi]